MKNHLSEGRKRFLKISAALLLAIIAFSADGYGQKTRAGYYAHLKAEHARALKNHIGGRTSLRPALVTDCRNKFGLDSLRRNAGKSAHPYYAAADYNQDGVDDFAVVLYDSKQKSNARFTVLIFHGEKSGSYQMAYKSENTDLRRGGIWTNGFGAAGGGTTLTAGVFETDDAFWLEWKDGKYIAHDAAAESEN